ncbi:MAG: hypothetical protein Q8M83_02395, partial [bacterium]|nr:hypothetical protein [bacterium]
MASIETGGPTPEEMGIKPEEKNEIAKEVEKNPELKRLQDALDLLESEIAGHPLVAQSTVDIFEEISLKRAQEK